MIRATAECGLVIRKAALSEKKLSRAQLMEKLRPFFDEPLDEDDDLMSFGPFFGGEAVDSCIAKLKDLGLEYVDDFYELMYDHPGWWKLYLTYDPDGKY